MLKIKKIKKNGRNLDIYVKKPKFMSFMFLEEIDKMFKDEDNFFGTMIDETGKYVILKFVLRSKEDIIPYVKYGIKSEILEVIYENLNEIQYMLKYTTAKKKIRRKVKEVMAFIKTLED